MSSVLLPPAANDYRGPRLALWLFGAALFLKTLCSVNALVIGRVVAPVHGIPLATLAPDAGRVALGLLAIWALSQLLVALAGWTVLARYRAFLPTMLGFLLLDHLGRELVREVLPVDPARIPVSGLVNFAVLALVLIALPLSLRARVATAAEVATA